MVLMLLTLNYFVNLFFEFIIIIMIVTHSGISFTILCSIFLTQLNIVKVLNSQPYNKKKSRGG